MYNQVSALEGKEKSDAQHFYVERHSTAELRQRGRVQPYQQPSQNRYHTSYNSYLVFHTLLAKALKTAAASSKLLLITKRHQHKGALL